MATKLTTGRALAQQRARIVRKLERQRKRVARQQLSYNTAAVTDATLQAALSSTECVLAEAIEFIKTSAARYNKLSGGLGK